MVIIVEGGTVSVVYKLGRREKEETKNAIEVIEITAKNARQS